MYRGNASGYQEGPWWWWGGISVFGCGPSMDYIWDKCKCEWYILSGLMYLASMCIVLCTPGVPGHAEQHTIVQGVPVYRLV